MERIVFIDYQNNSARSEYRNQAIGIISIIIVTLKFSLFRIFSGFSLYLQFVI